MKFSSHPAFFSRLPGGMAVALLLAGLASGARAQTSDTPATPSAMAPAPTAGGSMPSASLSHGDTKFIVAVAEGSTNEVALSRLALDHASSDDVKAFAQMMITDHTKLDSALKDLASAKGVAIDDAMIKGGNDHVMGLAKKSGADFDAAYLKLMVKGHEDTVAAFQKEAAKGKDADVIAFANQNLPTISEHLAHAKMLAKAKS
jgi:putative membrane protein